MFEKFMVPVVVGIGGLILGALGIEIYQNHKVVKKVGLSIVDMKTASKERIQEGIVRKAVADAAESSVREYVHAVKTDVMSNARQTLSDEARKAVKEAKDKIQRDVGERISTEAALIDMGDLKKSVRDQAEEKILAKFDGNLDDMLDKFNDNLEKIQKIYGGIADSLNRNNAKKENGGLKITYGD